MTRYSGFVSRVVTSVILISVLVLMIFSFHQWLWGLILLIPLALTAFEYSRLFNWNRHYSIGFILLCISVCTIPFLFITNFVVVLNSVATLICWGAVLFWMFLVPVLIRYRLMSRLYVLNALMGVLVIVPVWYVLVGLHPWPYGLIFLLSGIWLVDIGGYVFGKSLGKTKLLPSISPGKTIEGVLGGLFLLTVYALALRFFYADFFLKLNWGLLLVLVLSFAAICVGGDLFESYLKRVTDVKDSGGILPGHGGILDRIDSMTALLP
ncbi:MAG: phosphatidate cytidylyltransferase, partial [Proteobacteria bacterium]|nr:phosphatidate cytidylyltransferase [Pseudomonadota bacterium]